MRTVEQLREYFKSIKNIRDSDNKLYILIDQEELDSIIELLPKPKTFLVAVTYQMFETLHIDAYSLEEAIEKSYEHKLTPTSSKYMDDSMEVDISFTRGLN